ncbi:homoserine dehydrogenase [Rarobacter incanus]|uniref:Homoserine dehydrogenase n=1 Tax=Rarobacter incanus TaxID=153494 RepID=A0A542SRF8_9MICO|nr:homoserine dehydrogenase [Rarobacter incanus]
MTHAPVTGRPLKIAVLGAGVVGTEVIRALVTDSHDLGARIGAAVELVGVGVRDVAADRDAIVPTSLLTSNAADLVAGADIVVELMGGIEPARTLILHAFETGASVVTANKALIAAHGPELYEAAERAGRDLYFEAAVAGAIPVVRALRESLSGDHVRRVLGIVNGTTNYILDQMTTDGLDMAQALSQAQELGYAEADPTADVEGMDAAAKAAIIAALAFHTRMPLAAVAREGITTVTKEDVDAARDAGYVIKLLAIVEDTEAGVQARVHPSLVPVGHPLAGVHGAFNAVFVEADDAGELMFYGRGAGGAPTASAVLGDIVSAARHRAHGGLAPAESAYAAIPIAAAAEAHTRLQIRLVVADRPGVLAQVSTALADHGVSIEAVRQHDTPAARTHGGVELIIITHRARQADLDATVAELAELDAVIKVASALRVEGV